MFSKILIANRGEIACRIIRTAQKLNIKTVAVYSSADANALHVQQADEAYLIGAAPSAESYLRGDVIIDVAKACGAEAIHPGYGFLSENAAFAEQCAKAGICFIGPSPTAITSMGEKNTAKRLMEQANVPVIPGYHGDKQDLATLQKAATKIGYPVLIKAVAGGGGKGMRVVEREEQFTEALASAQREAEASFSDSRVLLEKYFPIARHVEVQVFADQHDHCLYLFERDCSIQRRHQKIIEEAPAPHISEKLRQALGTAAVNAARAINYHGAGTIEFLLAPNGEFYFMEMNTRLQVEHPVTEMITGVDLVEWQLRVAAGEILPITKQDQLQLHGHAIETRIYAEDPDKNFTPSPGTIHYLATPSISNTLRIDSGVQQGDTISVYYDPMIAKLAVWGETREQATSQLQQALMNFHLLGVKTNISLLQAIAEHSGFIAAKLNTHFIAHHQADLLPPPAKLNPAQWRVLAAIALLFQQRARAAATAQQSCDAHSPWFTRDHWQLNLHTPQVLHIQDNAEKHAISALQQTATQWSLQLEGAEYNVVILQQDAKTLTVRVNQEQFHATTIFSAAQLDIFCHGQHHHFALASANNSQEDDSSAHRITAPMPGTLSHVFVQAGASVKQGDPLVVVEAMKMQHTLYAPIAGIISEIYYHKGDAVEEGAELVGWQ
jgi:3-methylcrotonyl-CoA carboxylase alpha subunit